MIPQFCLGNRDLPSDYRGFLPCALSCILQDQPTSRHSYFPQTNRDSSNVIGRGILLPSYYPKHGKSIVCDWSILKVKYSGLQE